jgi:hypothetical protein
LNNDLEPLFHHAILAINFVESVFTIQLSLLIVFVLCLQLKMFVFRGVGAASFKGQIGIFWLDLAA